eukprot:TRINITY_DN7221_c0_g2_i1.p1 TRINITY_DN7221_c0_g2~~TRINITY_DN7221_c0_g2_i1.p1  ORF type:complete len:381 (-),score=51.12 TRINITY_DN7221_c0_g2_i1:1230-2222(-)
MASLELDVLPPLRSIVPQLTNEQHKGQSGRVAVFGGCKEYTGAPYFASISALKMGADLSHVFCTEGAAPVIKSYSPELIVHPILQESFGRKIDDEARAVLLQQCQEEIRKWMPSFKSIIIGPGLGRDPLLLPNIASVIKEARSKKLPMVIDGDGLFIVTNEPEIVQGYPQVVLTPNFNEYKRLVSKVLGNDVDGGIVKDLPEQVRLLAKCMGVTIMKKGPSDIISDGITVVESDYFGSPRRCGGQGDVLSGCTGVFMTWAQQCLERGDSPKLADLKERISGNPTVLGALSASILVRKAAAKAFAKHKRGMVTTDLIEELAASMDELFPLC